MKTTLKVIALATFLGFGFVGTAWSVDDMDPSVPQDKLGQTATDCPAIATNQTETQTDTEGVKPGSEVPTQSVGKPQ